MTFSDKPPLPPSKHGPGWPLLALLVVGVGALAVAWFAITGPLTSSDQKPSYRYEEAVVGSPSRVNPLFVHLDDADRDIASLVFSGLTRLGPDGQALPDLAESWRYGVDGKSITFTLKKGVIWHSGSPFTSADVLFTFGLLANPKVQVDPDQAALWHQVACTAPGDFTVVCQLPEPFSPFLAYTTVGILPKLALDGVAPETIYDNAFNQAPIGTGPYRWVQLDDTGVTLRANKQYYLGAPQLDEIKLRFYPDITSAAAALVRSEVQGILLDSTASQEDYHTVASIDGLDSYPLTRAAFTILYLNNIEPPLNDASVRRAIALAIDTDSLISDLLGGRAVRADSPIVAGTWAFDTELERSKHSVGDARDLLRSAGWDLPEGAKVRLRNGAELRLTIMTDRDTLRGALADAIANQLAEIGVAATVVQEDSSALVRDFLVPRQYQAAVFGWEPGPDPDPYPAWHSSQTGDTGRNISGYSSEDADSLMEQARRTADLDARQRLYFTFQQIFRDDTPSVLLYHPIYTYFVSHQISGVKSGVLFRKSDRFRNVHEWLYKKVPALRE